MSKLKFYTTLIRRHLTYGGKKQALNFAWKHKRFWNGAEGSDVNYKHIGN